VTLETLQAAFCAYLLLGLVWAFLYALMEVAAPASFRLQQGPPGAPSRRLIFIRLFIFSYATLTGTGFGDVSPASPFAEIVACLEAMTAQVYLAVIIARLVGMQVGPPPPSRADASLDEPESGRDRPD
jgi:hypothetical protein